jgi:hypothetical protein
LLLDDTLKRERQRDLPIRYWPSQQIGLLAKLIRVETTVVESW